MHNAFEDDHGHDPEEGCYWCEHFCHAVYFADQIRTVEEDEAIADEAATAAATAAAKATMSQ